MTDVVKVREEGWVKSRWRPALGWAYIIICLFDFIIGPIWWTMTQVDAEAGITQQWVPLTLAVNGLFHLSMGAILGVTAWSRGREKVAGVAGDYYPTSYGSNQYNADYRYPVNNSRPQNEYYQGESEWQEQTPVHNPNNDQEI